MVDPNGVTHRIETLDGSVGIDVVLPASYPVAFEVAADHEPWSESVRRHTVKPEVLHVDERTGRSIIRNVGKQSVAGAVHSRFAPVEVEDVIIPYLDN